MFYFIKITFLFCSVFYCGWNAIADSHLHRNNDSLDHQLLKDANTIEASIQMNKPFRLGDSLTIKLILKDIVTKKPVTEEDLREEHTKKIHLLIFDKTLEDYQHVHPEPTDVSGEYKFSWIPTKSGPYRFWVDIVPLKTSNQELIMIDLKNIDSSNDVSAIRTVSQKTTVEELSYQLSFDQPSIEAGKPVLGTVEITKADGTPFTQLEPIMGTFAHIVALHEDFESLEHVHPMGAENPRPEERGGHKLQFHLNASKKGFLKIYVQVKIGGKEQFIPFGIEVI